jgi:hypothetical protein
MADGGDIMSAPAPRAPRQKAAVRQKLRVVTDPANGGAEYFRSEEVYMITLHSQHRVEQGAYFHRLRPKVRISLQRVSRNTCVA